MSRVFDSENIGEIQIQNALGTQFLIFSSYSNTPEKNGIFLVDLNSIANTDPNDPNSVAVALETEVKKMKFEGDDDPIKKQVTPLKNGHYSLVTAGNENVLCIACSEELAINKYKLTLAALRTKQSEPPTQPGQKGFYKFEKCPNATREIPDARSISELIIFLKGNDPKLVHTHKNSQGQIIMEAMGH